MIIRSETTIYIVEGVGWATAARRLRAAVEHIVESELWLSDPDITFDDTDFVITIAVTVEEDSWSLAELRTHNLGRRAVKLAGGRFDDEDPTPGEPAEFAASMFGRLLTPGR